MMSVVDLRNVWSTGGMIVTGVNGSTRYKETSTSATLSTTNTILTGLGTSSSLHWKTPATYGLIRGTA
jgi:hypothetical protein